MRVPEMPMRTWYMVAGPNRKRAASSALPPFKSVTRSDQAFANSCSTYSQFTRFSTNALR